MLLSIGKRMSDTAVLAAALSAGHPPAPMPARPRDALRRQRLHPAESLECGSDLWVHMPKPVLLLGIWLFDPRHGVGRLAFRRERLPHPIGEVCSNKSYCRLIVFDSG